jgi:hypothetical protein
MESTTEKYPVCPDRNTSAAFRWFYEPLSAAAFLKARRSWRRAAEAPLPAQPEPARMLDRG